LALMANGKEIRIGVEVNNLPPDRFVLVGKPVGKAGPEEYSRVHVKSESGKTDLVYVLPPGVTLAERVTFLVEPQSQEDKDEMRARALRAAHQNVRTTSAVGLAAQPQTRPTVTAASLRLDEENEGLTITSVEEVEEKVDRVLRARGYMVGQGRRGYRANQK